MDVYEMYMFYLHSQK